MLDILRSAGGIVAVTLADAASFLASAALLLLVRTSGRTAAREGGPARDRLAAIGADLHDGLRLAARHRTLRLLMTFALVTSVDEGIMGTLFTPFVENVLHGTPQDLGFILAAQAVGGIAGGMAAAASGRPACSASARFSSAWWTWPSSCTRSPTPRSGPPSPG